MGAQIQGAEDINGNLAVESKAIEANSVDLRAVFIESANLSVEKKSMSGKFCKDDMPGE